LATRWVSLDAVDVLAAIAVAIEGPT